MRLRGWQLPLGENFIHHLIKKDSLRISNLYFVCVRAVLVFGSAEVGDTGNYTCAADQTTQTVLLIVTPGPGLPHHIHYLGSEAMEI